MNFYIKIGVPNYKELKNWGDYHFAAAMKRSLERSGHRVTIQILPEWDDPSDADSDVTIHLMGLSAYKPKKGPLNVMWMISHPEKASRLNLNAYDLILVASRPYASALNQKLKLPVHELIQFYDSSLMYHDFDDSLAPEIAFVGNSRKVYRQIIKDLMPCPHDLNIWGRHWDLFIDKDLIKAEYYPYEELRKLYSSAKINLNDHWEDMSRYGFVNNRVLDVLACGGFLISDYVSEIDALLPGCVPMYETPDDLKDKIAFFLGHDIERQEIAALGKRAVESTHTVDIRMQQLLDILANHHTKPKSGVFYSWFKKLTGR